MDRNQWKFLDSCRARYTYDNPLNAALRLDIFLRSLGVFRKSPSWDDAFCKRLLDAMAIQYDELARQTKIGYNNWPVAQANALVNGGLVLDFHPNAKAWFAHGLKVLNGCYALSFRPNGTFIENTAGYHDWVVSQRTQNFLLKKNLCPDLDFHCTEQDLLNSCDFSALALGFSVNDTAYPDGKFEYKRDLPRIRNRVEKWMGVKAWKAPERKIFPDDKIVFGGNGFETVMFDASTFSSWHMHYAMLAVGFAADGYNLLGDPGIRNYSRATAKDREERRYFTDTPSHATVNFNHATQTRMETRLPAAEIGPDFTYAVGEFNGGHVISNWDNQAPNQIHIDADCRRMVLHFPDRYFLVFDRTQVLKGKDVPTNFAFPVIPHAQWHLDKEHLKFYTEDAKLPNLLIQMVVKPGKDVTVTCEAGKKNPMRGWISPYNMKYLPAPLVEFSARGGNNVLVAATLLKYFPKRAQVPEIKIHRSAPGVLDMAFPDGSTEFVRWSSDLLRTADLSACGVNVQASVLAIRKDKDGNLKVWVGRELQIGPIGQCSISPDSGRKSNPLTACQPGKMGVVFVPQETCFSTAKAQNKVMGTSKNSNEWIGRRCAK